MFALVLETLLKRIEELNKKAEEANGLCSSYDMFVKVQYVDHFTHDSCIDWRLWSSVFPTS